VRRDGRDQAQAIDLEHARCVRGERVGEDVHVRQATGREVGLRSQDAEQPRQHRLEKARGRDRDDHRSWVRKVRHRNRRDTVLGEPAQRCVGADLELHSNFGARARLRASKLDAPRERLNNRYADAGYLGA